MFNNERNNMTDQPFKIDMYFNIRYYAKKHSKTITRRAKWDEKCRTWIDKKGNPCLCYWTLMQIHITNTEQQLIMRCWHDR